MDVTKERMLLTSGLDKSFPQSVILLTTRRPETPQEMRIVLSVPGLSKDSENHMRMRLADALRQVLPNLGTRWVERVKMKFNLEIAVAEIIVTFKDPNPVGAEAPGLVLSMASDFLVPTGKELFRRVFVLSHGQRLVPLDFVFVKNSLSVTLPPTVELVHPYSGSASTLDPYTEEACTLLRSNLTGTFLAMEHHVKSVAVVPSLGGFQITLEYERDQEFDVGALDFIKLEICDKVSLHGRLSHGHENYRLVCCAADPRDTSND